MLCNNTNSNHTDTTAPYWSVGIPVNSSNNDGDLVYAEIVKPKKSDFVFKVLNIVSCQLIITFIINYLFYLNRKNVLAWCFNDNLSYYKFVILILMIMTLCSMVIMWCFRENKWLKIPSFIIFTLSIAITIGISILPYSSSAIIIAILATSITVVSVNSCAFYCSKRNIEFTFMGPYMVSISMCFLLLSLVNLIFMNSWLIMILAIFGSALFSAYLLYDLNNLYLNEGDNFCNDPFICAINIYLDIINIFSYLLIIIGGCNDTN